MTIFSTATMMMNVSPLLPLASESFPWFILAFLLSLSEYSTAFHRLFHHLFGVHVSTATCSSFQRTETNSTPSQSQQHGDTPNHTVLEIVASSGYIDLLDLMSLKVVCQEWKYAIEETTDRHEVFREMVEYLNTENRLHECHHCHRPIVRDGSTNYTCSCQFTRQKQHWLENQAAFPVDDPRVMSMFTDGRGLAFALLPLPRQANLLFRFHQVIIHTLRECYQNRYIDSLESLESIYGRGLVIRNTRPATSIHRAQWMSLLVAKESLKHRPNQMALELLSENHVSHDEEFFAAMEYRFLGGGCKRARPCATATRLFGPALAKTVDIFHNVRTEIDRHRKNQQCIIAWRATHGYRTDELRLLDEDSDDDGF